MHTSMYIVHTSDWYQTKLFAQVNFESDHEDEEDVDMGNNFNQEDHNNQN